MTVEGYIANSAVNQVVEAVIGLMNDQHPYAAVTRGALPVGAGIAVEIDPTMPEAMHMDKNTVIPLDVVINAKHPNYLILTDTLIGIHAALTRATSYPVSGAWQIIDINTYTLPRIIGREQNNDWLAASALRVTFYWRG